MMNAKATDKIALSVNLNSSETAIDNSAIPFSTANTDSYNYSTPMTTYDSLGNKRDLQAYFARRPATAASSETKWNVYVVDPASSAAPTASELYFNQQGRLVSGKPSSMDFTLKVIMALQLIKLILILLIRCSNGLMLPMLIVARQTVT